MHYFLWDMQLFLDISKIRKYILAKEHNAFLFIIFTTIIRCIWLACCFLPLSVTGRLIVCMCVYGMSEGQVDVT